jgi:hypothetical protein
MLKAFNFLDWQRAAWHFWSMDTPKRGLRGRRVLSMLDEGGNYRFYVLSDLENGALKHSPSLQPPGHAHVYLLLNDLVSGSAVVHAIPWAPMNILVLNIAGSRASKEPGVRSFVLEADEAFPGIIQG